MKNLSLVALLFLFACSNYPNKTQLQGKKQSQVEESNSKNATNEKVAFVCPPCSCSMHDKTFVNEKVCPECKMKLVVKE